MDVLEPLDELEQAYKDALIALLPQGIIWEVKPGSVEDIELTIEAKMFAEIHRLAEKLTTEANLLKTKELLSDWEGVFELPHEGSYEDRIAALNASAAEGQLSRPQYITLCAVLGAAIEIKEHYCFRFGLSRFGSRAECAPPKMVFWWDVNFKKADSENAVSQAKTFINKYKMSHTKARFIDERTN